MDGGTHIATCVSLFDQVKDLVEKWGPLRAQMLEAIEYTYGTHTEDDVLKMISSGKLKMWATPKAILLTEFIQFPQLKALSVFLGAGDIDETRRMERELLEPFARENGCTRITGCGRLGWTKALPGYAPGGFLCTGTSDMPIGKGGSSGKQDGTSNSQTAGNSSNAGLSGQYSSGIQQAIAPKGYEAAWNSIMGMGGTTPGQTAAGDFFSNGGANSLLNPERSGWYGANDRNANLQGLATPGGYSAMFGGTPTAAQPLMIAGQTGAAYMDPYSKGYTNDVVNATTNDLVNQYGRAQNASNMAGTAAGGFQNSRMGLRDAQVQDDFLRNLGMTTGALRDQGFGRAMQGGQFDASQNQAAQGQNVANMLDVDKFNAAQKAARDQMAAGTMINANQAQMGNTATAAGIGINAANSAAGIGGQQFGQGLAALGAGTPLFGQSNQATNKGGQVGANDAAGNSDSQTSGKSSSKGGGLSIG